MVGGGYAGLASAYRLSKVAESVDLFDSSYFTCQNNASLASSGLLHPFNSRGGLIWGGLEGLNSAIILMDEIAAINSADVVYKQHVFVRPLSSLKGRQSWSLVSHCSPDWSELLVGPEQISKVAPQLRCDQAVMLKIFVVDSASYLKQLWQSVLTECNNARWIVQNVMDVRTLSRQYDVVVVACGPGTDMVWNSGFCDGNEHSMEDFYSQRNIHSPKLAIKLVKGQNLFFERDHGVGVLCGEYLAPVHSQATLPHHRQLVCGGATHEHLKSEDFTMANREVLSRADTETAQRLLSHKLAALVPDSAEWPVVRCIAGVRAVAPRSQLGRLPMCGRHPVLPNVWMAGGFGSRGLVHHGLVTELLTSAICADDATKIPACLAPVYFKSFI